MNKTLEDKYRKFFILAVDNTQNIKDTQFLNFIAPLVAEILTEDELLEEVKEKLGYSDQIDIEEAINAKT